MELKRYLSVILRRWPLVLLTTVSAGVVSALLLSGGGTLFEASTTYLVRPAQTGTEDAVRATDALNRSAEINSTYARIARSSTVKDRAKDALREQGLSTSGLSVSAQVIPGTNLIEISASGPDEDIVPRYAEAIGDEAARFLVENDEVYELHQLDPPDVTGDAVGDSDGLSMVLSLFVGAAGGAALAFGIEYLTEEDETVERLFDPETDAYSSSYFRRRFRQELSRCGVPPGLPVRIGTAGKPEGRGELGHGSQRGRFVVATVALDLRLDAGDDVADPRRSAAVRDVAQVLMAHLRDHDIVGHVGPITLGVIFPDTSAPAANQLLSDVSDQIQRLPVVEEFGGRPPRILVCEVTAVGLVGNDPSIRMAREL